MLDWDFLSAGGWHGRQTPYIQPGIANTLAAFHARKIGLVNLGNGMGTVLLMDAQAG